MNNGACFSGTKSPIRLKSETDASFGVDVRRMLLYGSSSIQMEKKIDIDVEIQTWSVDTRIEVYCVVF